jgi:hypothetical protein
VDSSPKVLAVHHALDAAGLPHAIGGARALAFYGAERPTEDIDLNVFVAVARWPDVGRALGSLGVATVAEPEALARTHEVKLDWDGTEFHLFFSYDELHATMPAAVREVPFADGTIPIVAPEHLVVRKAMLDRPKDWLDIDAILVATEALDLDEILAWLRRLAGDDDPRVAELRTLVR